MSDTRAEPTTRRAAELLDDARWLAAAAVWACRVGDPRKARDRAAASAYRAIATLDLARARRAERGRRQEDSAAGGCGGRDP